MRFASQTLIPEYDYIEDPVVHCTRSTTVPLTEISDRHTVHPENFLLPRDPNFLPVNVTKTP
jgi:hypothetical protein